MYWTSSRGQLTRASPPDMCLGEVLTIPHPWNSDLAASCICGNEHSDSIKYGEFFWLREDFLVSQDGLCWMESLRCSAGWRKVLFVGAGNRTPTFQPADSHCYDPVFPFSHLNHKQPKLLFLCVNFLEYFKLCAAHKRFRIFASICAHFYCNSEWFDGLARGSAVELSRQ